MAKKNSYKKDFLKVSKSVKKKKYLKFYLGVGAILILLLMFSLYKMGTKQTQETSIVQITPTSDTLASPAAIPSVIQTKSITKTATSTTPAITPAPIQNTTTQTPISASAPTASTYSISGYVFNDSNDNGNRDEGEMVISNAQLYFLSIGKTATTDSTGRYSISDLPPGTYNITMNSQNGMRMRGENPAFVVITASDVSKDFGFN